MATKTWAITNVGSGERARWTGASGLLTGYCTAAVITLGAILAGGTRHNGLVLGLVILAPLIMGSRMTVPVAVASGVMSWLFYDGFVVGRHAVLVWHGSADLWGIAACSGAGLLASGIGVARRRHRSAAPHGVGPTGNVVSLSTARHQREVRRPAS